MESPFVLSLSPVTSTTGPEASRLMLAATQASLGMIPNMYARMANAPVLLQTYQDGYARFRSESMLSPAEQEVVFLSISVENGCEYCVAAHSYLSDHKARVANEVTDAIRDGAEIPDARLGALSRFTRHLVLTRGRPTRDAARAFFSAGFTETHVLYLVLAIAVKTISNYSNHLFETPVDDVFAERIWHDDRHPAIR